MKTTLKFAAALALLGCCLGANAQEGEKMAKKESKMEMKEDKAEMKAGKGTKMKRGGGRNTVKTAARREGQMMKQEDQKMDEKGKM